MLLDTSGLLCLVLESESFHARAVEAYDEGEIVNALTTDQHFEQEGYRRLLV